MNRKVGPAELIAVEPHEKGAALLMVAGMLVALLGVSAFAVDLGWLYLSTARLQKAADAAALAGVVNLPASPTQADTDAQSASAANDFIIGSPATNTFASQVLPENQYEVTLGSQVGTFFLRVLGFTSFDISRTSTAQYIQPVPLGGPGNTFGGAGTPFWAAIKGPYTAKEFGDAYATRCHLNRHDPPWPISGQPANPNAATQCQTPNSEYARGASGYNGYYYAVEVPSGLPANTTIRVELYDAGWYTGSNPGDYFSGTCSGTGACSIPGVRTSYRLLQADTTPYSPTNNPPFTSGTCASGLTIAPAAQAGTYRDNWVELCRLVGSAGNPIAAGIYPLHVQTSGPGFPSQGTGFGHNGFGIRAVNLSGGANPSVYGIGDMHIYINSAVTNGTFYLAEIDPVHAGKDLELGFFDPGDQGWPPPACPSCSYEVLRPNGSGALVRATGCTWEVLNGGSLNRISGPTTSDCFWSGLFNGNWIKSELPIPATYACNPGANGCYWHVRINMPGGVTDSTTWTARVIGNPVRLVPNAP